MKYYLIVGEASGDLHASNLMKSIKAVDKEADFRFFGGDLMSAVGGTRVKHYRELAYPHRISTYYRCYTNDDIKTALVKHGPVLVSMNTYEGAKIVNDTYTYDPRAEFGRHCVLVYGYDERGWLIQNSWGTLYAGDGRFVMPFDCKFNEAWGITDEIISDEVNIKKRNKFTNFIYKVYNKIVNWWLDITDKT